MKRRRPSVPREDSLARLLNDSRIMDPNLKRYWLGVLDHLTPASRERLKAILTADTREPDAPPADVGRGLVPRR